MIVAAAASLFRDRGYRGASIEDIGAAVGMTGPAIYRHFPSKEALLAELLGRAVERARRDVAGVLAMEKRPIEALEQIVQRAVAHSIEEGDVIAMAVREGGSLSQEVRQRLAREQRSIRDAWIDTLRAASPELSAEEARAIVQAVSALILSIARADGLKPAPAASLFTRMAMAALLAR